MSETSSSTKTDVVLTFRTIFMEYGQTVAYGCRIDKPGQPSMHHAVPFPTGITPAVAAAKLRELADWIVENAK